MNSAANDGAAFGDGGRDAFVRTSSIACITAEGDYTRVGTADEIATQLMVYDRRTVDRCLKYAFELKKKRNAQNPKYAAKPITLIHKRNVLTYCGDLWYRAFEEMGANRYPELKRDYNHVDAANSRTIGAWWGR